MNKRKLLLIMAMAVIAVLLAAGVCAGASLTLPQTGQTKCYSHSSSYPWWNEAPCAGTGQDGDAQAGLAWPSQRFTQNADTTVTDNLTGLVWIKDGNIMVSRDEGWDTHGTTNDGAVSWQHALNYVKKLNAENYLGHDDWRLPNVNELESLVNADFPDSFRSSVGNSNWAEELGGTVMLSCISPSSSFCQLTAMVPCGESKLPLTQVKLPLGFGAILKVFQAGSSEEIPTRFWNIHSPTAPKA